jgi:hypothetical protein
MRVLTFIAAAHLLTAVPAYSQLSQSAAPVKDLVALMTSQNQAAIAAKDPETGGFVAALLYPGVQLLVVSGKPTTPEAADAQLAASRFQEVYAALHDAGAKEGRLFIQDMGADGLTNGGDSVDVAYDEGRQTLFDNNPRAHKISSKDYRDAFAKADARYARMVGLLLERTKQLLGKS